MQGNSTAQAIAITVTDVDDEAPVFSGSSSATIAEHAADTTITGLGSFSDNVGVTSYALSGADAALFNLNTSTGQLEFKASPDFENPADQGGDNVYDVTITASDAKAIQPPKPSPLPLPMWMRQAV